MEKNKNEEILDALEDKKKYTVRWEEIRRLSAQVIALSKEEAMEISYGLYDNKICEEDREIVDGSFDVQEDKNA